MEGYYSLRGHPFYPKPYYLFVRTNEVNHIQECYVHTAGTLERRRDLTNNWKGKLVPNCWTPINVYEDYLRVDEGL